MNYSLLVGWHNILVKGLGLLPQLCRQFEQKEGESRDDFLARIGLDLVSHGLPVWYVPELDDRPRIERIEVLRWAKTRWANMVIEKHAAFNKE